ncbi:hypothetical protein J1792_08440 [Streptomyces triculaminicus]|uniref:Uncharacterized protein n=1 Tax=Streptomyces triculaminicus TaxID=2816232 RepID=A0A939JMW9_9ACTN|nr:hypothetical protein [Streptomyces triculaminicus]
MPITEPTPAPLIPVQPGPLPDVQTIQLPDGRLITGYALTPVQPELAPVPVVRPVPSWAKTTALLAPTVGGGIAAAGYGLSAAAPGLIAAAHALWAAAALLVLVPLGAVAILRAVCGRPREEHTETTQIVQVTATGLFGRANGTINNR